MGFLRRLFGRDIKTDTAVQNGYTLVADDTKTSGIDWSDVLVRGGLGRDLADGINNINSAAFDIDTTFTPGEYYYGVDTLGDTPSTYGLVKVWRESSGQVYQLAQSSDKTPNRMFTRYYGAGSWGLWTDYSSTGDVVPSIYTLETLSGSGTWEVPPGVTQVTAIIVGSGSVTGNLHFRGLGTINTYSVQYHRFRQKPRNVIVRTRVVTEGSLIVYACGAGAIPTPPLDLGSTAWKTKQLCQLGGVTQFGSDSVLPAECETNYYQDPNITTVPSDDDTANPCIKDFADRPLVYADFHQIAHMGQVYIDTRVAGTDGYIQLLYR